jgi:hypothetical protein
VLAGAGLARPRKVIARPTARGGNSRAARQGRAQRAATAVSLERSRQRAVILAVLPGACDGVLSGAAWVPFVVGCEIACVTESRQQPRETRRFLLVVAADSWEGSRRHA